MTAAYRHELGMLAALLAAIWQYGDAPAGHQRSLGRMLARVDEMRAEL